MEGLILTLQVIKVIGGGWWWWPVGLQCQPQTHSLSSVLWIWDFGLGFGTQDLDLGFFILL